MTASSGSEKLLVLLSLGSHEWYSNYTDAVTSFLCDIRNHDSNGREIIVMELRRRKGWEEQDYGKQLEILLEVCFFLRG